MSVGEALTLSREVLDPGTDAWVVGGAVRDQLLDRAHDDLDLVIGGDVAAAARALARAGRAAAFELSDDFGAWRVVRRGAWQIDVSPLHGGSLTADLQARDFTVNAIAQPLRGGELIDPLGGLADLRARRLRLASARAFDDDPLRVLRLVRLSLALEMVGDPATLAAAGSQAPRLRGVAGERVFAELRAILVDDDVVRGLTLMDALGALAALIPELYVPREAGRPLDVAIDAVGRVADLEYDPAAFVGSAQGAAVAELLDETLADDLARGTALRLGALLGDVAGAAGLPAREDARGDGIAREIITRLRAGERVRAHVAGLVRHRGAAGALVRVQEPQRRAVYAYLRRSGSVAVDATLLWLSGARGGLAAGSPVLARAQRLLGDALSWRAYGPPPALVRGDELAAELGIERGPRLGELLEGLSAAQYAGEVMTREQAVEHARALLAEHV